ncbi:MAG: KH domain-containing protein [Chloracidobacterium sp.]|nr:KH domain-containing protein [Chloracidobacterium sp.]MDW8218704.1 KH domain-containing protein [Acidobacteriota bacterium]
MADPVRLVEHMARALVDNPEAVSAVAEMRGQTLEIRLTVAPQDVGKIIGRHGRTITAMRSVLSAIGSAPARRVTLEVEE